LFQEKETKPKLFQEKETKYVSGERDEIFSRRRKPNYFLRDGKHICFRRSQTFFKRKRLHFFDEKETKLVS